MHWHSPALPPPPSSARSGTIPHAACSIEPPPLPVGGGRASCPLSKSNSAAVPPRSVMHPHTVSNMAPNPAGGGGSGGNLREERLSLYPKSQCHMPEKPNRHCDAGSKAVTSSSRGFTERLAAKVQEVYISCSRPATQPPCRPLMHTAASCGAGGTHRPSSQGRGAGQGDAAAAE